MNIYILESKISTSKSSSLNTSLHEDGSHFSSSIPTGNGPETAPATAPAPAASSLPVYQTTSLKEYSIFIQVLDMRDETIMVRQNTTHNTRKKKHIMLETKNQIDH